MSIEEVVPRIIFPKPLPSFEIRTEVDDTGFSSLEKMALQNAWRVIKRRLRRHAKDIFLKFFAVNELLLERFRGPSGKFHMESLHQHPHSMLRIYGRVIEEGLQSVATMNVILAEVVTWHRKHKIEMNEISLMTHAVKEHLQAALTNISSPTLTLALDKMCDVINDYHNEEKQKEKETDSKTEEDEELESLPHE